MQSQETVAAHTPASLFGAALKCTSLQECIDLLRGATGQATLRCQAAAQGMVVAARPAAGSGRTWYDAQDQVTRIAQAKAAIDAAACHELLVAELTSDLLRAAQIELDRRTMPCTEWPMPEELADSVLAAAQRLLAVVISAQDAARASSDTAAAAGYDDRFCFVGRPDLQRRLVALTCAMSLPFRIERERLCTRESDAMLMEDLRAAVRTLVFVSSRLWRGRSADAWPRYIDYMHARNIPYVIQDDNGRLEFLLSGDCDPYTWGVEHFDADTGYVASGVEPEVPPRLWLYGRGADAPVTDQPTELGHLSLEAGPLALRAVGGFLLAAADRMETLGTAYDHERLSASVEGFEASADFVVAPPYKP